MRLTFSGGLLVLACAIGAGCSGPAAPATPITHLASRNMKITSPAFGHNQPIPPKYTCDGQDLIPPLVFEEVPTGTKSLTLIMDDPDAPRGTWDHWIVFDLPADAKGIEEGKEPTAQFGQTSSGDLKYGGPCPPGGQHRYAFKLYALDTPLGLPAGSSKKQVEAAMQGHVLDQAELIGLYSR